MLEGSLKDQYSKLYPSKHQDSLSLINSRFKDSIIKVRASRDSITIKDKKEVKFDSVKNKLKTK